MGPLIDSCEAKTHLPQLLERVAKGERIIMKRGVPMAVLASSESIKPQLSEREALRAKKRLREENVHTLGPDLTIREMIEEGRPF